MLLYIWYRATFPRFRFDQLMDLGWKFLIPLALANIFVTGIFILLGGEYLLSAAGIALIAFTVWLLLRKPAKAPPKVMHASPVSEG